MRRLTYALEFVRKAAAPEATAEPIVASSVRITTTMNPKGVQGDIEQLGDFETATLEVKLIPTTLPGTFTETGKLTFGGPGSNNNLYFSSIGLGYVAPYKCPEEPYTAGVVSWVIVWGEGFFEGASGIITSNFLVDKTKPNDTGELIAYHFGVIYLP
ncbi:MAG: hypothetical protein H7Y30_02315 [Pyrinomonadaceae bacterium]|nr:hypothetical protein [Pyrinomonadaceae bacterium]